MTYVCRDADVDPREAKRPVKVASELKSLSGANRFQLGNGMQVVLLPIKSMPLVSARLIFNNVGDAGASNNQRRVAVDQAHG
mgnify:CR=1 FL=1